MPHLESQTIRPLYDVHDGGPPVGFQCKLKPTTLEQYGTWTKKNGKCSRLSCNKVTRTLAGMRIHQRIVHGITLQQEFRFERIEATTDQQNG